MYVKKVLRSAYEKEKENNKALLPHEHNYLDDGVISSCDTCDKSFCSLCGKALDEKEGYISHTHS